MGEVASRLILNADDFGLTPGVNRAVAELHRAHALTSATLMANGAAYEDAVEIARATPALGVGCHVVLVDGTPVCDPRDVPTLLDADGRRFRASPADLVGALLRGAVREEEIEREATAQVRKLQKAGIEVTHLDTHKHTHLFPAVTRALLRVAGECSVGAMRNPFEPGWSFALGHGGRLRRMQIRLLGSLRTQFERQPEIRDGRVKTTDGTVGISTTGQLDAKTLREILHALPAEGTFELCCHPGYNDSALDRVTTRLRGHREVERAALLEEMEAIALHPNAPRLIHYGELGSGSRIGQNKTGSGSGSGTL